MMNSQRKIVNDKNRLIRILYFSSFGETGRGGQESLFYLVSNLDRSAFCPHVVVPKKGSLSTRLKAHGIKVSIINFPKIIDFAVIKKFKSFVNLLNLISKYEIDILHTDGPRNTFYAGLASKIKNIPLIWHVRSSDRDRFDWLLYKISSRIIIVSNSLRSRFNFNKKCGKLKTIYNGVDLSEYKPEKPDGSVRRKYKIDANAFLILVTARIHPMKGQKYLIKSCRNLKSRIKDFYVLLAGEVDDFSYLKKCKKLIKEFNIEDRVIFLGKANNVSQLIRESNIVVLPSVSSEAFPRSIIEAMAISKPVIATDIGGCSEAVQNNISGYIIKPRDSKALADRIYLLHQDKILLKRIGKEARHRAESNFGVQDNIKKTEKLYRVVLRNSRKSLKIKTSAFSH
jgi:glycosyltransferase involved in cell wall biosynthesis